MILRGWKEICRAAGGMSAKTARYLVRHEGMPVAYEHGSPMTTDALLEAWLTERIKKCCQDRGLAGSRGSVAWGGGETNSEA